MAVAFFFAQTNLNRHRNRFFVRIALACIGCTGSPAFSHGFGQRFDLPLPLSLWLVGAAATIILTFAMIALFVRDRALRTTYPSIELTRCPIVRTLLHSRLIGIARAIA